MFDTTYDDCWLQYEPVDDADLAAYRERLSHAYVSEGAPELGAVRAELQLGLEGMLGDEPHFWQHPPRSVENFLVIGHPEEMRPIHQTIDPDEVWALEDDSYVIRTVEWEGQECTVITAPNDAGLVYGTFDLLRRVALGEPIDDLDIVSEPANNSRIINHWDNPFRRSVERGYAGQSIFDWERLPDTRQRYFDYARLLSSVGINGVVPNNVNTGIPDRPTANDAVAERAGWQLLERENLEKLESLASVFRRYGIQIYLSVNYAAPIRLGDLETADPHDPEVQQWWQDKVDEIYEIIPDFGGFLVKADSEGQPGPYDYDRSHAEGANVLGEAFEGHSGRVWCARSSTPNTTTAPSRPTKPSNILTASSTRRSPSRSKTVPSTSSSASPSRRCSVRCPRPIWAVNSRSPASTPARASTQPTTFRCGKKPSSSIPTPTGKERQSRTSSRSETVRASPASVSSAKIQVGLATTCCSRISMALADSAGTPTSRPRTSLTSGSARRSVTTTASSTPSAKSCMTPGRPASTTTPAASA